MTDQFAVTSEMVSTPDATWTVTRKSKEYDEDLNLVESTQILTGESAFAFKATEIIASYEAHVEARKQHLIKIARRLLAEEGKI